MKSYAPTIESLKTKAPRELHAIFRRAASDAISMTSTQAEQVVARKVMEAVRRCMACAKPPA